MRERTHGRMTKHKLVSMRRPISRSHACKTHLILVDKRDGGCAKHCLRAPLILISTRCPAIPSARQTTIKPAGQPAGRHACTLHATNACLTFCLRSAYVLPARQPTRQPPDGKQGNHTTIVPCLRFDYVPATFRLRAKQKARHKMN